MTLSHDDANARLLDLVYGEAAPAERAALEAHVATCAACTADLAALGDTHVRLRTALEDAPVPARVHARLLEAATQAAAPVAVAAAAAPVAAAARARAVVPLAGPSFWARLRGKWTLPTFATVGALAIVVIGSKVFLDPQGTMEKGREVATAPAADNQLRPRQTSDSPFEGSPKAAAPADEKFLESASRRHFGPGATGGGRGGLLGKGTLADRLSHHSNAARPRSAASSHGSGVSDNPLDGLGSLESGLGSSRGVGAAPAAPLPPKASHDDLLEGTLSSKPVSAHKAAPESLRKEYAAPPSGWKGNAVGGAAPRPSTAPPPAAAPAAAPPPPAAEPPAAERRADKRDLSESPVAMDRAKSEEKARMRPAPVVKKKAAEATPMEAEADEAPPATAPARAKAPAANVAPAAKAEQAPAKDADKKVEKTDPNSREVLARRADQLFEARRWSEAIAAYRELIRRYPDAELKPRWQSRIAQAQVAAAPAEQPAAARKASKKTTSDDALDGL